MNASHPSHVKDNQRFIHVLHRVKEIQEWLFLPRFFDGEGAESLHLLSEKWRGGGVSASLCQALVPYGHVLCAEYRGFIMRQCHNSSWANSELGEDLVLLVSRVLFLCWDDAGGSHMEPLVVLLENVQDKYGTDGFTELLQAMLMAAEPKTSRSQDAGIPTCPDRSYIESAFNLLMDTEDLEGNKAQDQQHQGFSIVTEACHILQSWPLSQWDDHLRSFQMRVFAIKFPEKPMEQVRLDFQRETHPMDTEHLDRLIERYEQIQTLFLSYQMNRIKDTASIKQKLAQAKKNLRSRKNGLNPNSEFKKKREKQPR
eukprot:gb/GECH01000553.1/.p1 GENE.gb/GECH01000553.1/~~gb/GECH01000553.1/.p1  ORF type:complete len:313 (+),score=30.95 gb/GECH01000553.1/:1-939(+)